VATNQHKFLSNVYTFGNMEQIDLMTDNSGNISAVDKHGCTLLHYACLDNDMQLVKNLTENGADVSVMNNRGNTPLYYACCCGNMEIAKFLIDSGADVSGMGVNGCTMLKLLTGKQQEEIEAYVLCLNLNVKPAKR
jgi:hypothetical protein